MSSVAEIQQAIVSLTKSDYAELMRWLSEYDWEQWDKQIGADSQARVGTHADYDRMIGQ